MSDYIGYDEGVIRPISSARTYPCAQTLASPIVQQPAARPQVWRAAAVMVAAVIVPCAQQCILAFPLGTLKKWACFSFRSCQVRLLSEQSRALRMAAHFPEH